jgi:hypothetical protein
MINKLHIYQILTEVATDKTFVSTIVANVATEIIWLDTPALIGQTNISLMFIESTHCHLDD